VDQLVDAQKLGWISQETADAILMKAEKLCDVELAPISPPSFVIDRSAASLFQNAELQPATMRLRGTLYDSQTKRWGTSVDAKVTFSVALTVKSAIKSHMIFGLEEERVAALDANGTILSKNFMWLQSDLNAGERGVFEFKLSVADAEKVVAFYLVRSKE